MASEIEHEAEQRRRNEELAERAVNTIRTGMELNHLPRLPSLDTVPIVAGYRTAGYVQLGGCNHHVAQALGNALMTLAKLSGRVIDGEARPLVTVGQLEALGLVRVEPPTLPGPSAQFHWFRREERKLIA